MTPLGKEYDGDLAQTTNGRTCQRWDSQYPHGHTRNNPADFPDASLAEAANYCRNPDDTTGGPWCYTTNPSYRWEYCNVPWCKIDGVWSSWSVWSTCSVGCGGGLKRRTRKCDSPKAFGGGTECSGENEETQDCNSHACECKETNRGREVLWKLSVTTYGRTCQRWDSQSPHSHTRNDIKDFPDESLYEAHNYCRNPDNEPGGPWCYTTDSAHRWEYCDVPKCEKTPLPRGTECRLTHLGTDYHGFVAKTRSGRTCQRWDSQSPHSHSRDKAEHFPDPSISDAANYCRNPDDSIGGAWCYTVDADSRWEYCDIPFCRLPRGTMCKQTWGSQEYLGYHKTTENGRTCQRWDSNWPHAHTNSDPSKFPDETLMFAENYCRDPGSQDGQLWCYTDDPSVRFELCDVPWCPMSRGSPCKRTPKGAEYHGFLTKTVSGRQCQRWDTTYPHNHGLNDATKYPDETLADAANFCRNPDGSDGPWCYTTDSSKRWEYCDVPLCPPLRGENCRITQQAAEYQGFTSTTSTGKTCQRWDAQYPHSHSRNNADDFPDVTMADVANYCRNPDGEPGPWCYTTDPATRWQYCDIPFCY